MNLKVKIHDYAKQYYPDGLRYETAGANGLDLCVTDQYEIYRHACLWGTGISVEIPIGYAGLIIPRSSAGCEGFRLSNTVGDIDADYRGEVKLALPMYDLPDPGSRVAQLVIVASPQFQIEHVDDLSDTVRGSGSFGSTG